MSRQNIYEIVSQRGLPPMKAFSRIRYRYDHIFYEDPYDMRDITLYDFTQKYVFQQLPIKGTCIDLADLLQDIGICLNASSCSLDDVFLLIEFILCVIDSTPKELKNIPQPDNTMIYDEITEVINATLDILSMKIIKSKRGRIIVPKSFKAAQAASVVSDEDIAWDLLQYNHFANKGNIKNKQAILKRIGDYIEPTLQERSKNKEKIWNKTAEIASDLLNNFNIRHNNKSGNKKQWYVTNMDDIELEKWYDKTYSVIIQLIIERENEDILKKIKQLRVETNKDTK